MHGTARGARWVGFALALCAFRAAAEGAALAPPSAARSWIEGDVEGALATLGSAGGGLERELNLAVVRLYAGDAAGAEAGLERVVSRRPGWTPALRWLARAQHELGRPAAGATAAELVGRRDATAGDRIWAGRLFLDLADPLRARQAFAGASRGSQALPAAWLGLAEAETRLGNAAAAREAARRGDGAGEPAPQPPLATMLHAGERLRYRVRYLFLNLANVTLDTGPRERHRGRPAHKVSFTAKSGGGLPFFHIDSRYESVVGLDGAVLAHRNAASDSDGGDGLAAYEMEPELGRCVLRTVRDGLLGYEVLPLPEQAQDGVSVLLVARALARARGSAVVPTVVDAAWWPTRIETVGVERIRWNGREARAVRLRSQAAYRGPGGLSGGIDIWVSDDERAVPYRVKMKVAVGSVVLELLPDDDGPPAARVAAQGGRP